MNQKPGEHGTAFAGLFDSSDQFLRHIRTETRR
jgi:hypothetical protein